MPDTCPVAALGREAAALIEAYTACEKRRFALQDGAERARLERLGEHIDDRRLALHASVAGMPAQSLAGAMFQLLLAQSEAELLRNMAAPNEDSDAEQTMRRIAGLLYSAVRVLERESGVSAEELGGGCYMPVRYDPHPAIKAALAGEPIPPASDGDE